MKKSISITLACAIGAGLGTMLAINFGAFWILGLLVGGVIGYFVYDFKKVVQVIPEALVYAKENIDFDIDTESMWRKIRITTNTALVLIALGNTGTPSFFILNNMPLDLGFPLYPLIALFSFFVYFFSALMVIDVLMYSYSDTDKESKTMATMGISSLCKKCRKSRAFMILVLLFSPLVGAIYGLGFLCKYFWKFLKIVPRFLWKFFVLIHSDLRLLVGIDSLIGGAIGFYFGNILIGMFAGAILGFVNYYFVSLKILKLKPEH